MSGVEEAAPGKQLGRLEILAALHLGRNGDVFRALDTRTNQEVGVKVFPLERGAELRFDKRHHTAASLRHPNIVSVQRLLSKPGISYMITEPLDGHSLEALLRRGPMSPRDVVQVGIQIADGLAAGHAAGILHGDLGPENILIAENDVVKILDFGFAGAKGPVDYTSPEQVRGEPASPQSDVFSLGSLLYSMATDRRPFEGYGQPEIGRAILEASPDELPANVPPELTKIIGRCLEKNPADRWQTAADVAAQLRVVDANSKLKHSRRPKPAKRRTFALSGILQQRRPVWLSALIGALAVLITGAVLARNWLMPPNPPDFQRLTFRQGSILRARFAPGGKRVVYTARFDGSPQTSYVGSPGETDGREILLPENSSITAVSSKGDLAVRLNTGELIRVPLDGGLAEHIQTNSFDADWAPDGNSLAVARHAGPGGRFRVEYPAGNPLYETDSPIELVRISPKGDRVAFTVVEGAERKLWVVGKPGSALMLTSLGKGEPVRALCWSPDGSEIWYASVALSERGSIQAITPDGKKRRVAWMPDLSLDDVTRDGKALVETLHSWSGVGLSMPDRAMNRDLSWHGQTINALLSADGQRVVFTEYGGGGDGKYGIYSRAADGSPAVRVGDGEAVALSPDGRWVTAYTPQGNPRYSLLPSLPGDASPIVVPGLEDKSAMVVGWLSDGRRLIWGKESGKKSRHFLWTPTSDQLSAVTPEETPVGYVSADASRILAGGAGNQLHIFFSDGSPAKPVRGLRPTDRLLRWAEDRESVFVATQQDDRQSVIEKVNLTDGARSRWSTLDPPVQAEAIRVRAISADGRSVIYSYYRSEAALYLAGGLR